MTFFEQPKSPQIFGLNSQIICHQNLSKIPNMVILISQMEIQLSNCTVKIFTSKNDCLKEVTLGTQFEHPIRVLYNSSIQKNYDIGSWLALNGKKVFAALVPGDFRLHSDKLRTFNAKATLFKLFFNSHCSQQSKPTKQVSKLDCFAVMKLDLLLNQTVQITSFLFQLSC